MIIKGDLVARDITARNINGIPIDSLTTGGVGLFEVDTDGNLTPVTDNLSDNYYELDANDDIMPIA